MPKDPIEKLKTINDDVRDQLYFEGRSALEFDLIHEYLMRFLNQCHEEISTNPTEERTTKKGNLRLGPGNKD